MEISQVRNKAMNMADLSQHEDKSVSAWMSIVTALLLNAIFCRRPIVFQQVQEALMGTVSGTMYEYGKKLRGQL
jgi:hypothetical protein